MATEPKLTVKFHSRAGQGPTGSGRKELRTVSRRKGNYEDSRRQFSIRRSCSDWCFYQKSISSAVRAPEF